MTFEEILNNTANDDNNYQQIRDEDLTSTLDHLQLRLILVGYPLGLVEDPTREAELGAEHTSDAMDIDQGPEVLALEVFALPTSGLPGDSTQVGSSASEDETEFGGVRETLDEILANAEPNFSKANPSNTFSKDS